MKYREDAERVAPGPRPDARPMSASPLPARPASRGGAARLRPRPARGRGAVTADRERTLPRGGRRGRPRRQRAVYWAGRATLCASPADLDALRPRVRRVVQRRGPAPRTVRRRPQHRCPGRAGADRGGEGRGADDPEVLRARRARPRCCATATSRPSPAASASPGRAVRAPCARAPRAGARTATRHPRAGPSTPAPPCARTLRRMGEPGRGALAAPRHPGAQGRAARRRRRAR